MLDIKSQKKKVKKEFDIRDYQSKSKSIRQILRDFIIDKNNKNNKDSKLTRFKDKPVDTRITFSDEHGINMTRKQIRNSVRRHKSKQAKKKK
tara:strand:- start:74 stop:349 length:276 start_codon:yes stop_codon:yes gene_type:complete